MWWGSYTDEEGKMMLSIKCSGLRHWVRLGLVVIALSAGVYGAAVRPALAANDSQPFSLLGYQGDLAVYRAELMNPPVTLTLYAHKSGGGLIIVQNRLLPDAGGSAAIALQRTAGVTGRAQAGATAGAGSVEVKEIGQTPDGGTVLGVFVDGKLTTLIFLDKNGRFVKAVNA